MTTANDEFSQWDAAYVLGALSPADRRAFEEHLSACPRCQRNVSEVAGVPGLLSQVSPEDAAVLSAEVPPMVETPPASLMPRLLAGVRARRRRMALRVVGIAAAVALLVGAIGFGTGLLPFNRHRPSILVAFAEVQPTAITANATVVPDKSGTDVRVECQYGALSESDHQKAYADYSVWVVPRSGDPVVVKTWAAKPNKVMTPSGHTNLPVSKIRYLEIRDAGGHPLLRAKLP